MVPFWTFFRHLSYSIKNESIWQGVMGRFKPLDKKDYLRIAAILGIIAVPLIIAFYAKGL